MRNRKIGNLFIYTSLLITFLLWVLAKDSIGQVVSWPLVSLTQISALLGTMLFVWSMILSTRLDFLENWFGGLDKVYKVHRRVSETGAVLILIHPITLVVSNLQVGLKYFLPIHNQNPLNLGIYAFWIFTATILLTLFMRRLNLPYHIWKHSHKFLNLAMILTLLHVVMIKSDTSSFVPLGMWMSVMVGLGVASGLYMSFFYKRFGPRYKYKIVDIKRYGDVHDVYLKHLGKKLPYKLAQFAYVSFFSNNVSKESHPYCITSLPGDDHLRFSIKELGDYTSTLGGLKIGDTAAVWGSYGRLGERFESGEKDAVFVAGGIGVAPFLSMFKKASLSENKLLTSLFYCTKYKNEASFDSELQRLADKNRNLKYCNQCSRESDGGGHLSTEQIRECISDIKNTVIYLCGPTKMMLQIKNSLKTIGVPDGNIVLEDFEMI